MHRFRNGSEKLTIRQALSDTWRGVKILHNLRKGKFIIDCVRLSIWAIHPLVILFLSSLVISELSVGRDIGRIALYVSLAVGFGFLLSLTSHILTYIEPKICESSEYWERHSMLWDVQHADMEYRYVEDADVTTLRADAHAKLNAGALGLMRVGWFVSSLLGQLIAFVGAAVLVSGMFFIPAGDSFITSHWILVLLIAASIIVPAIVSIVLIKRRHSVVQQTFNKLARFNTLSSYYRDTYVQTPDGGLDVRIFKLADPILKAIEKSVSWFKEGWAKIGSRHSGINSAIGAVFIVLAFLVIGLRALEGMYDIGEVTRFVGATAAFSGGVVGIIYNFSELRENAPYLGMTYDYMDLPSVRHQDKPREKDAKSAAVHFSIGNAQLPTECESQIKKQPIEISFHNVSFKYPRTDSYVLKNLNITFSPGERLAVVGMNGSGKTTMIKLLCRLYEPTEGHITLDGVDIRDYDYDEYITAFAVVFQDFCLTGLPLGQNISASESYDPALATVALEKTGFGDRLKELELGLETCLYKHYDKDGVPMSGGELQKIALARAIYKNTPFVALDEPTAALDPIAEYEIYSGFNELIGDKTAVFISHRLSSCRFCHRVAVFHEGEIIQHGTHEELLSDPRGKYHEMWHAQAQYYESV